MQRTGEYRGVRSEATFIRPGLVLQLEPFQFFLLLRIFQSIFHLKALGNPNVNLVNLACDCSQYPFGTFLSSGFRRLIPVGTEMNR